MPELFESEFNDSLDACFNSMIRVSDMQKGAKGLRILKWKRTLPLDQNEQPPWGCQMK
jgi:hypothetical protein